MKSRIQHQKPNKGVRMSSEREALIQAIEHSFPGSEEGRVFLEQEERAIAHTEYIPNALPTLAQVPEVASLYMRVYGNYADDKIALGVQARELRAREAAKRTNILFMTEQALDMDAVIADDGERLPIEIPEDVRQRQLTHLSTVALQPHIDFRLIRRNAILPDIGSTILLDFEDNTRSVFTEKDGGIHGPITSPQEIEPYLASLDYLHVIAMSREETLDFLAGQSPR